ncbi:MAG: NAD(P)/FAD-dependent oxidoreductase [Rhodospirillales bacterium]|nr:NAD(P)/FAD-dependent oxidoreductase [Rhodospirillales bacterium]
MTYVVVGAGPSGVIAAESLRKSDPDGEIILIGDEPEPPYSRMALPYFLVGNIEDKGTHLRKTAGHYESLNIKYVQDRVASVSPADHTVTLASGATQGYSKLLIATGASPVKPPIEGLDLPGVHHCWTLADARKIIDLANDGAHVVLVGAGFIGCIILESLVKRGVKLTVVEADDRMVPRMMNQQAGGMIKSWCLSKDVNVLTSTRVTKLEQSDDDEDILTVDLDNGQQIPAHLVVIAAGVKSNTAFLEGSGVEVKEGIVVDKYLKTCVDDIYAAGDCAQGPDIAGGWSVHAIQPTCADHGQIAGKNMAGIPTPYKGSLVMNVLDTIGLISVSYGNWEGKGDGVEILDAPNYRYMRLEFDGDRLIGALSLGRTEHVGVLRGLIQTGVKLGEWKEKLKEDPQLIMEAYVATKYV